MVTVLASLTDEETPSLQENSYQICGNDLNHRNIRYHRVFLLYFYDLDFRMKSIKPFIYFLLFSKFNTERETFSIKRGKVGRQTYWWKLPSWPYLHGCFVSPMQNISINHHGFYLKRVNLLHIDILMPIILYLYFSFFRFYLGKNWSMIIILWFISKKRIGGAAIRNITRDMRRQFRFWVLKTLIDNKYQVGF